MSSRQALHAVLVEDSELDAELVTEELKRAGYAPEIVVVDRAETLRTALRTVPCDVVIADYNLPSFTGLEALEIVRQSGLDVPFFLVSGSVGEELAISALKAGAHDYLLKDNLARLGPAIQRELRDARLRQERRHDVERLRSSERRFNAIFQSSPVAIVVTSFEDGVIIDANAAACTLLGYSRAEMIGHHTTDFGAWTDSEERRTVISRALVHGQGFTVEREIRRRDGSVVTVLVSFSLMEVEGSNRLLATMQDITARKDAERGLRESEERFRSLVENSSELILEIDLTGRILYASPNHLALTGRHPDQLVGTSGFAHIHPDDLAQLRDKFAARAPSGLYRNQFADGSWHWLESSGSVFRLSNGEERAVIVSRDVTERVEAEHTRKHMEERLRQAQKLEALGTLAGGIAHDFNNILTAMMAYMDLALLEPGLTPLVRQHLGEVRLASERAKDLVRQILAFSRQQKQERKPLVLEPVLHEVLKLLRSTLPATIEITSDIAADVPTVFADPVQVHQVILNLATNAAHAMRDLSIGRLRVSLSAVTINLEQQQKSLPELRPGRHACIEVTDNGVGMDALTVKRAFEPFFTTKGPGEGTGLGLAVVHGIMRDHEGSIDVTSSPGVGTTFRLYFPEYPAPVPQPSSTIAGIERGQGEHILFIDDEPAIGKVAKRLLERLGYQVTAFADPVEAVEHFAAAPLDSFHLVISDLSMPRLSGIDVAQRLLRLRPGLPIVLISGFSATWTPERLREVGIEDLVPKPLSMEILAGTVRNVLNRHPPATRSADV